MTTGDYLDSLLTLPGLVRPEVSRDGTWVAWTWFRMGPAADVFAAPTDGTRPPIRLSDTPENTFLVSWTPDSSAVIVSQDRGGNERDQLFRIDLARPGAMVSLTEPDPNYFLRGGELHPNGRFLVYGANVDIESGSEIEQTWIYRHDLETGERKVLARPERGGYTVPHLSSDGALVIYPRNDRHPAGQQIWLVGIDGQNDHEVVNVGDDKKVYASWIPGTHQLLVLGETETHRKLGILDLSDEHLEWILDDPQRNIEDAYVPYGSREIVIIEVRDAHTRASLLNPSSGVERPIVATSGTLTPLAPISANEWVGQFESSRQPGDVVRFAPLEPLYDHSRSLSRVWDQTSLISGDFAQAEDYHWISADGLRIQGFLYRPKGIPKGTIVYVHGGPTYHSQDRINSQIQLFVREGYVVLDPNYRGSTGFGMAFQEAIKADGWGGREQDDIRAGIASLIADGIALPGKVGITGTSYGGYSAWWAITHFPRETLAAGAPICGMTDLVVDYESTRPDLRPYSEEMMGGSPAEVPAKYHSQSPINFVDAIEGELLIVQGGRDPNVTPENVRVVRSRLDQAGVDYEVLNFDDEGHGIIRPDNQRTLYLALLDFFDRAFGLVA